MESSHQKTPQHDIHELANQFLLFEHLHCLYENKDLRKCRLSSYIHMTRSFRLEVLNHLGFSSNEVSSSVDELPKVWLRGAKLPPDWEGLADKGFQGVNRLMPNFNQVRCPKILMKRQEKQCDSEELSYKGECCRLRHTSEAVFSFFENVGMLKDGVPYHNIKLIPYALEWGCGTINLQKHLRKPGQQSGLPADHWN